MFRLFELIVLLLSMNVMKVVQCDHNVSVMFPYSYQAKSPAVQVKKVSKDGEWRKVENDAQVPPGSSVKVDVDTKEKYVKLDDGNEKSRKILEVGETATWDDIKHGLKQLKNDAKSGRRIRETNREYVQLTVNELNTNELRPDATEMELLTKLLLNYTKANLTNKMHILHEIEYLVHKFSMGQAFTRVGGLSIFKEELRTTESSDLKALIIMTLGSAAQGNTEVKTKLIFSDFMPIFLEFLRSESEIIQLRTIYALSTFLRNDLFAQDKFIKQKGYSLLSDILHSKDSALKLKRKTVILIADLLDENDPAEYEYSEQQIQQDLRLTLSELEQRRDILHANIIEYNLCSAFSKLLYFEDDDVIAYVTKLLSKLKHICNKELYKTLPQLHELMQKYTNKMELEKNSYFLKEFRKIYVYLSKIVSFVKKNVPKDEL